MTGLQAQGAADLEQEQRADLLTGKSPASEWLHQLLPCFSGQQQEQEQPHSGGPSISHAAAAPASQSNLDNQHQADQILQQQLDAKLGRGQLFHCWRRKADGPKAAVTSSRPRRASFHAGQHLQSLSGDPVPLHGPGRPPSLDQLPPQLSMSGQPFGSGSSCDVEPANPLLVNRTSALPHIVTPAEEVTPSRSGGGSQPWPDTASLGTEPGRQQPQPATAQSAAADAGSPGQKSHSFSRHHLAQPEASEASSFINQRSLKHQLASSETSSTSRVAWSPDSDPPWTGQQAATSDSSSGRPSISQDARNSNHRTGHLHPEARQEHGQVGASDRPVSPTGPHGPLFVPIVLTLERRDHEVLLREAASRIMVRSCLYSSHMYLPVFLLCIVCVDIMQPAC